MTENENLKLTEKACSYLRMHSVQIMKLLFEIQHYYQDPCLEPGVNRPTRCLADVPGESSMSVEIDLRPLLDPERPFAITPDSFISLIMGCYIRMRIYN